MAKKNKYDYKIIGRKGKLYISSGDRIISLKDFNKYVYYAKNYIVTIVLLELKNVCVLYRQMMSIVQ